MPTVSIDTKVLSNLRRDAARAPKASAPKPKAKVTVKRRTDPQREAKLALIAATPLDAENRQAFKMLLEKRPEMSLNAIKLSLDAQRYHYTNAYKARDRADEIRAETRAESERQTKLRSRLPFTLSSETERFIMQLGHSGLVTCQVHHHGSFTVNRSLHVAQIESLRSQGAIIYPVAAKR